MTVDAIGLREAPDATLRMIHALEELLGSEAQPDDPGRPFEDYAAAVRSIPSFIDVEALIQRDSTGVIAGEAECVLVRTDDNPHVLQLSISVRPDLRRRGIARTLLAAAVELAVVEERSVFVGVTTDRVPAGELFARRVGGRPVNSSHVNRLLLAGVDRELIATWTEEGSGRSAGYSLLAFETPLPDEVLDGVASFLDVMNDAPGGDSDLEDRHTTPEQMREWEHQTLAAGAVQWWLLATQDSTRSVVGLTEVTWNPSQPRAIQQGNTGVAREHRGHALGKWLKAAMLQRIIEQCPHAVEVRTNNTDSNDAMVGINRQLGFEHYIGQTTWHADVAAAQAYLRT